MVMGDIEDVACVKARSCESCLQPCAAHATEVNVRAPAELQLEKAMDSQFPIRNPYGGRTVTVAEVQQLHEEFKNVESLESRLRKLGVDVSGLSRLTPGTEPGPGPATLAQEMRSQGRYEEFVAKYMDEFVKHGPPVRMQGAWQHREAFESLLASVKAGKPRMSERPLLFNAHNSMADRKRFDAELEAFASEVLLVGLSSDLASSNSYQRLDCFGKSMILTRDRDGRFHCFQNSCRHRGAQLVSRDAPRGRKPALVCPYHSWAYGTDGSLLNVPFQEGFEGSSEVDVDQRNLVELPSLELHGLLFVLPKPPAGVSLGDMERLVHEALGAEFLEELQALRMDEMVCAVEQEIALDANWKLGVDTFCEAYHFSTVHKGLSDFLIDNMGAFKFFGDEAAGARNCRSTLGQLTVSLLAKGDITMEQAMRADPFRHLNQIYHFAPNLNWLFSGMGICESFQLWPGSEPGKSTCVYRMYVPREVLAKASSPEAKALMVANFTGTMQVVACEDFPLLAPMQQNFESNTEAEVLYGRHECVLQNWHKWYRSTLERHGFGHVLDQPKSKL